MKKYMLVILICILVLPAGCESGKMVSHTFRNISYEVPESWKSKYGYPPSYQLDSAFEIHIRFQYVDTTGESPKYNSAQDLLDGKYGEAARGDSFHYRDFQRMEDVTVAGKTAYHISFSPYPHTEKEGYTEQYIFDTSNNILIIELVAPDKNVVAVQQLKRVIDSIREN